LHFLNFGAFRRRHLVLLANTGCEARAVFWRQATADAFGQIIAGFSAATIRRLHLHLQDQTGWRRAANDSGGDYDAKAAVARGFYIANEVCWS
jgi:hypothetical protein